MTVTDTSDAMSNEQKANEMSSSRSPETRALMSEAAKRLGKIRSDGVRERVQKALREIEKEMDGNKGIYPHNKGAISAAEVARRADVHQTTFFGPKQVELGNEVRAWLKRMKEGRIVGRGRVRRALADRVGAWKELYDGLAQSHRDTELDLQQAKADLDKAHDQLQLLKSENDRLTSILQTAGTAKVVPLTTNVRE